MIRLVPFYNPLSLIEKELKLIETYINENGITKNDFIQLVRNDRLGCYVLVYEDNKPYIPETETKES